MFENAVIKQWEKQKLSAGDEALILPVLYCYLTKFQLSREIHIIKGAPRRKQHIRFSETKGGVSGYVKAGVKGGLGFRVTRHIARPQLVRNENDSVCGDLHTGLVEVGGLQ